MFIGKRYIFDIQRTSREAYDNVKRKLYARSRSSSTTTSPTHTLHSVSGEADEEEPEVVEGECEDGGDSRTAGGSTQPNRNNELQKEVKVCEDIQLITISISRFFMF